MQNAKCKSRNAALQHEHGPADNVLYSWYILHFAF